MEHFYQNIGENWFNYQNLYSRMVSHFPDGAHFVEVGSWKGRSASYMAVEIINSGKKIKFDCVDTWMASVEHYKYYPDLLDNFKSDEYFLYRQFLNNVQPVIDYINPIKLSSVDASKLYQIRSLDFVYLDGSHEYEDVYMDILSWYPKVKVGGFLGGHDYGNFEGVTRAVNELITQKGILCEFEGNSWIVRKR